MVEALQIGHACAIPAGAAFEGRQAAWLFESIYRLLYPARTLEAVLIRRLKRGRAGPRQSHVIDAVCLNALQRVKHVKPGQAGSFHQSLLSKSESFNVPENNSCLTVAQHDPEVEHTQKKSAFCATMTANKLQVGHKFRGCITNVPF